MSTWQPIASAPKDGTHILGWDCFGRAIISYDEEFGWTAHSNEGEEFLEPVLWAPLLEPPK